LAAAVAGGGSAARDNHEVETTEAPISPEACFRKVLREGVPLFWPSPDEIFSAMPLSPILLETWHRIKSGQTKRPKFQLTLPSFFKQAACKMQNHCGSYRLF
jgi:hypothetical protein